MSEQKGLGSRSRRRFLIGAGAVVGAGGLGLYGLKQSTEPDYNTPAYRYWGDNLRPEGMDDATYIVLCGTLAASPHNTQPWKFKPAKDRIEVYADRERNLGAADPDQRMLIMGVGCALENMRLTARQLGYRTEIRWHASDAYAKDGHCASLVLQRAEPPARGTLFPAIFERQTNRAPYDMEAGVPSHIVARLSALNDFPGLSLSWYCPGMPDGHEVLRLTRHAVRQWVRDDDRYLDCIKWWRYTREELLTKRDGISIHTTNAPFVVVLGMEAFVTPEMWAGDIGRQGEIDWVDKSCINTPVWGLIHTADDGYDNRVRAGMLAERLYLGATRDGFSLCPVCYTTEIERSHERLRRALAMAEGQQLMFLFRLGKAAPLERSVRRDLHSVIV